MTMRCLIVDDEAPARQRLRRLLGDCDDLEIAGESAHGLAALEDAARLRPDLIFLDIAMPELDGLGVAAALPAGGPAIVFVTAYDEHAVRAFELSAIDYLVKPVDKGRLAAAIERVRARRKTSLPDLDSLASRLGAPARMAVRCGARYVVFDPQRVCAIVSRDHYSAILVDGKELLADDSLDVLQRRIQPPLLRVHRGALLNVAFLRELVHEGDWRYVAVMTDAEATRIPISRDRLSAVKLALGIE